MNRSYVFHRENAWYPLELKDDEDARVNAERNEGTVKVTREPEGVQVWPECPECSLIGMAARPEHGGDYVQN